MASRIPTFILSPNWDIPVTGPVVLGSIIADPKNPAISLNKNTRLPIPDADIVKMEKHNWSRSYKDLLKGRVGVFTTFLAPLLGIGADLAVKGDRHKDEVYKCDTLETTSFDPDDDYIAASLALPMVKRYASTPHTVYMVTGRKIARGGSIETTAGKGYGGEGKVSFDGTQSAVPLGIGPKLDGEKSKTVVTKFGKSDDFVIAYQLVKIKMKSDGTYERKDFNKLALMDDGVVSKTLHEVWDISKVDGPVDGMEGMNAISGFNEEDEQECRIIPQ